MTISQKMMDEQLALIENAQDAINLQEREIKKYFVQQYLSTREYITHSFDHISLADTSEFSRRTYLEFKDATFVGLELLDKLDEMSAMISEINSGSAINPQTEEVTILFTQIADFSDRYAYFSDDPGQLKEDITLHLKKLAEEAPILLYLGNLEGLKISLIKMISAVQQHSYRRSMLDYFTQLSPFLLIPASEMVYVPAQTEKIDFSAKIYSINRYDVDLGLLIESIRINNQDTGYTPDNPRYQFSLPVNKSARDSVSIQIEAKAITHEGVDTTFTIERKFKVSLCP